MTRYTSTGQPRQRQRYTNNPNYNNNRLVKIKRIIPIQYNLTIIILAGQLTSIATRFLNWQAPLISNSKLDCPKLLPHYSWCHLVLQHCSPPCCQLLVVDTDRAAPRCFQFQARVSKARTSPSRNSPTESYSLKLYCY